MPRYEITPLEQAERFTKLAEVIESRPDQFDMSWWVQVPRLGMDDAFRCLDYTAAAQEEVFDILAPGCGTRACIAGWTVSLWGHEIPVEAWGSIEEDATALLGLDGHTRDWLFDAEAKHQSAEEAGTVLRVAAAEIQETGERYTIVDDSLPDDDYDDD